MAATSLLFQLLWPLLVGPLLSDLPACVLGSLNLEELNEMRYGIEILPRPVIGGQSQSSEVVIVSSKYKQRYECRLPAGAIHFQREHEEEAPPYKGPGVPELLNPMRDAPCLVKTKDWWTYEFCYGRHIQQYHMEDSEIKGSVLYLGYYQSSFNWDDETAKASKQHRLKRYHSQNYGNGSKCDLNGRPRETEVRFLCDEGSDASGDYIDRVDEPQSCSYVLTIRTPRLCSHPLLRPPPSAAPQAIRCHPTLQPEQYGAYIQGQVLDAKQKIEEISEKLHNPDLEMWSETKFGVLDTKGTGVTPPKGDPSESDIWSKPPQTEEQATQKQEAQAEEQDPNLEKEGPAPDPVDGFHDNVQVKVIRNPGDLVRFIEELKGGTKKGKLNPVQEGDSETTTENTQEGPEVKVDGGEEERSEEEEEDEEERLLGEFEKELEGMLLPSDRGRLRFEVKTGMEKELDNIIQEAESELDPEEPRSATERSQASQALASTLNKLIQRMDGRQGADQGEGPVDGGTTPPTSPPPPQSTDEETERRVRVRVTRLRAGGPNQDLSVFEMKRENPQVKHIEGLVKDLLEREGLTAEGKVEIKIVRPGAGETEEEDGHWLSDEDTKNLKEIFFNILIQGAEEAQKERQRQRQLESNYRRVWGPQGEEGTGDHEEFDF
ncbi:protein OS-9 isoform X1 [Phascolarctos cinereus]|uniref:Endoplasmic reticulum lectin n=1 Tax=Phascolarctos cinereus TaxID=38626 RepID=A0A6P5KJK8_PHACI|nr:protein OS-9 isoform X1 [Phascolarctos cinereus]